jgi:hypothetical protein
MNNLGEDTDVDDYDMLPVDYKAPSLFDYFGGGSNSSFNGNLSQNNYSCSFHCVGRWEQWRGPKHTVSMSASHGGEAINKVSL